MGVEEVSRYFGEEDQRIMDEERAKAERKAKEDEARTVFEYVTKIAKDRVIGISEVENVLKLAVKGTVFEKLNPEPASTQEITAHTVHNGLLVVLGTNTHYRWYAKIVQPHPNVFEFLYWRHFSD